MRLDDIPMICYLRHTYQIALFILLSLVVLVSLAACKPEEPGTISGVVLDEVGPVEGAVVRVQATENWTSTDESGLFVLSGLETGRNVFINAWASGFYIVGEDAAPGNSDVEIHLHAHANEDNRDYEWLPSQYHPGQGENQGCAECHSSEAAALEYSLPVDEWLLDAHSQSATNPRFLTMYTGMDVNGNKSPDTRFATDRDYGTFPLRPCHLGGSRCFPPTQAR